MKSWKVAFFVSIIVPVVVLATLKLTAEPAKPETTIAEIVEWECDRPRKNLDLSDRIESTFINDEISISVRVDVGIYHENYPVPPWYGGDGLEVQFTVNVTVKLLTVASFVLRIRPADTEAKIYIKNSGVMIAHDVMVKSVKSHGRIDDEAYILADMTNSSCSLIVPGDWVFCDQNPQTHELNVTLGFTYRTDNAYRMVQLPILLEVIPDVGNTFDTATSVSFGEYRGCIDNVDTTDIYALLLQKEQTVNITLNPLEDANYDLYLYGPKREVVVSSESTDNATESITPMIEMSGIWYVEVKQKRWPGHNNEGIYMLNIS